jgi:hypothetical protein
MFEETDDAFIWRCDTCGLAAEFPAHDFWRALGELKARSWQISRERDGEWTDACSRCRPKKTSVAEFLNRKAKAS